jgi:hypothetical protein
MIECMLDILSFRVDCSGFTDVFRMRTLRHACCGCCGGSFSSCAASCSIIFVRGTTGNIHFYDKNLNVESETVIEERFLWRIFPFRHRSVVTILQASLSITKSGIITKNIIEEHMISSQITRVTHLWWSPLILWQTGLRHWTSYTYVTNNIRSITNGASS